MIDAAAALPAGFNDAALAALRAAIEHVAWRLAVFNDILWSYVLIAMLVGLGLWFTARSRFAQFRFFAEMFRVLARGLRRPAGRISSFQALAVSIAGRVGSGNIAGVAAAIALGGPGAVFWMWLIGLMGMATSLFECSLAQLFKRAEPGGAYRGGPAYYITRGLKRPWLAAAYSIFLLATFGFGFNAVQSYVVAASLHASFGVPPWLTGALLAASLAAIIFGGIRRIVVVAEVLVPAMALGYLAVAMWVLATNIGELPGALARIVAAAFGFEEAVAGGFGAVVMQGVKRGLFSNEAGLGSAPNVAAVAHVPHPVHQGMVQSLSVFIDTLILCTCTAAMIILSDAWRGGAAEGIALTQAAVAGHVGAWGEGFISVALLLFAFSTIMYNYYLGENSLDYFSGGDTEQQKRARKRALFMALRVLVPLLVLWGALQDLSTVFAFAEITMGLLGVANLAALAMLAGLGFRLLRDYDAQRAAGREPRLDPAAWADVDIDPAAWR